MFRFRYLGGKKSKWIFFKCDNKKHRKCFIYQFQIINKTIRIAPNLNVTSATKQYILKVYHLRYRHRHNYGKFPVFHSKLVNINYRYFNKFCNTAFLLKSKRGLELDSSLQKWSQNMLEMLVIRCINIWPNLILILLRI